MKTFQNIKKDILLLAVLSMLISCEEVIEIDLNSSAPALVAEGKIYQDSLAYIRLSLTSDYFSADPSEIIANAQVNISDDNGNTETLQYLENGVYIGNNIIGTTGRTYTITVEKDNINYNAETSLFDPVKILDVSFTENDTQSRPGSENTEETNYSIEVQFSDDPKTDNFYLIKYWNNGEELGDTYNLTSDIFKDANAIVASPMRLSFVQGSYQVEVSSIDEATYNYYSQLNDLLGGNMMSSSTPYNPISNFDNNVMGYFTAISFSSQQGQVLD